MSISTLAPQFTLLLASIATTAPATQPAFDPTAAPLAPTTQPTTTFTIVVNLILLFMTVLAIALVVAFRVYRPGSVIGPRRLPAKGKMAVLLLSLGLGLFAWLGTITAYSSYVAVQLKQAGVKDVQQHFQELLTPKDLAVLSTAPQLVAFGLMVLVVALAGDSLASRLGLSLRKLPRGVGAGVLAFICTFPLVLWGSAVVELIYHHFGFRHPAEHELLKSFGEAKQPRVMLGIVFGAAVCAPMFEEFLFRGHLQTLLRELFLRLFKSTTAPRPAEPPKAAFEILPSPVPMPQWGMTPPPPPPGELGVPVAMLPYVPAAVAPPPLPLAPQTKSWPSWLAIVITSLIFGLVHPFWMTPLIFLLALGLGYIYERTGILWASITVHLLFNSTETLQYYLLIRGH